MARAMINLVANSFIKRKPHNFHLRSKEKNVLKNVGLLKKLRTIFVKDFDHDLQIKNSTEAVKGYMECTKLSIFSVHNLQTHPDRKHIRV